MAGTDLRLGLEGLIARAGISPELAGHLDWVDPRQFPPSPFIASPMNLAMMNSAERYDGFVANLLAEGTRLRMAKMVRVGRLPSA